MPGPAIIKGALQRLFDAIDAARRGEQVAPVPKWVALEHGLGHTENELLDHASAASLQYKPLPVKLRNEGLAIRMEPEGLEPYSPRAHYDATGGTQLGALGQLWRAGDDAEYLGPPAIDNLRLLDLRRLPKRNTKLFDRDPFMNEGSVGHDEWIRKQGPFGFYPNEAEGSAFWDVMHNAKTPLTWEEIADPKARLLRNASLYVPRSSTLYRNPLLEFKKDGGGIY